MPKKNFLMSRSESKNKGTAGYLSEGIIRRYSLRTKGLLPGILRIKDKRALGVERTEEVFDFLEVCAN